jgi:hypothetical protein
VADVAAQWQRIVRVPGWPSADEGQGQQTARLKHSEGFAQEAELVRNVHQHGVRIGAITVIVRHRQREGRAMQDLYAVSKAGKAVEFARRLAKPRCQIHSGDAAPILCGNPSGRPANAAADIEEVVARLWLQQRSELLGRHHTLSVEMVNRRQALGRDRHILPVHRPQRGQHPRPCCRRPAG